MITLYHGSDLPVTEPQVSFGRRNLDFGQGFYVTKLELQAHSWAKIIASRKGIGVHPVVSVYEFDEARAEVDGVVIKRFDVYDIEWLEYVVDCRKGKDVWQKYDLIEGGVANDNVIDTVEDYEKGIITAKQALGQLCYKKINHQMCIVNQSVIERYLKFVRCEVLKSEEEEDE